MPRKPPSHFRNGAQAGVSELKTVLTGKSTGAWVSGIYMNARECRLLAKWLLRTADYLEVKNGKAS